MFRLVFLRHGKTFWNKKSLFTGWTDVELSEEGKEESRESGRTLKNKGFIFDIAFTSVLKRSIETLEIVLEEMNLKNIIIKKSWRLNERHYGALQGLSKIQMGKKHGEEQLFLWRRSFDVRPPPLKKDDERYPGKDPKYKHLEEKDIPLCESLKDVYERCLPYWKREIVPAIKSGKSVLVVAHGNSLRPIIKYIDNISDEGVSTLEVPLGIPVVYEFDENMKPMKHYYLADPRKLKREIEFVKNVSH